MQAALSTLTAAAKPIIYGASLCPRLPLFSTPSFLPFLVLSSKLTQSTTDIPRKFPIAGLPLPGGEPAQSALCAR